MAINFPSTAGQPTNGSYTYTVAGISYSWNGESWVAAGAGASATDRTLFSVSTNAASATPALSYNNNSGVFSYTPPDISDMATQTWVGTQGFLTATPQIVQGNSKAEVIGVGSNDGEFKVTLQDNTSGGSGAEAFRIYQPSAGTTVADLFGGNTASNAQLNIKHNYNGNGTSDINFTTNVGSRSAAIRYWGNLQSLKFYVAGAEKFAVGQTNSVIDTTILPNSNDTYNLGSTGNKWSEVHATNFYGDGTGLTNVTSGAARTTVSATNSIAANGIANISMTTPKTYALLSIETSHAAWVTLYSDTGSRTADSSRNETTDPVAGSGVLAEVITSGSTTQLITPASVCFNSAGANTTYLKIVNKSGSTANVQVILTYVSMET
tara:strand:+ start:435 stop:1571 length:1137 start_codon:yes stop_codon:yes gene_type:complete